MVRRRHLLHSLTPLAVTAWVWLGACGEPTTGDSPIARCHPEPSACGDAMFLGGIRAELGDAATGARAFLASCARCHGADGAGVAEARHIDMRSAAWQASLRDAGIVATIRAGRGTKMPAFDLPDETLRDLLAHVRSLGVASREAPRPAARGEGAITPDGGAAVSPAGGTRPYGGAP
jgi:cytochrome c553